MDLASTLGCLYTTSGLLACGLYGPQLRVLSTSAGARRAMSLTTWGGWSVLGVTTLAYAVVVVQQPEMVVVTAINALCQASVFALALGQRLADRRLLRSIARYPQEPITASRFRRNSLAD
jgi:hypothetical protein